MDGLINEKEEEAKAIKIELASIKADILSKSDEQYQDNLRFELLTINDSIEELQKQEKPKRLKTALDKVKKTFSRNPKRSKGRSR